ncbi:MAG: MATE family efflux transporter [Acidiferrobacterales bacterium]
MATLHARLTEGPVRQHLVKLTVPMIWGILALMLFYLTDTWFVAQLGAKELAAISFSFPVIMVLISLGIGLMAGTSSVLARAIGEGNQDRVRRLTSDAAALSVLVSFVVTLAGLLTIEPVFRLLGASDDLLPLIHDYMAIWYAGYVCFLVPMVGNGVIRATGDSRLPSQLLVGAAVLNLILDPLLIFGWLGFPRLELQGAAIASVASRVVAMLLGFYVLQFRLHMITYQVPSLAMLLDSWRRVLHVGLPAAGTNIIIPVSTAVIIALIADFGSEAVAGFGIATRIEGVSLVVFFAMSAIIGPFVGQNLGAGKAERIHEAMRISGGFCLGLGVLLAIALAAAAEPLARLFNDDPQVVAVASLYLWLVPISYGTAGIIMVANAAFNGLGNPLPAVVISVTRMFVIYIPLAYAGAYFFDVSGIFVAASLSNLLVGAAAYVWHQRVNQRRLMSHSR